MPTQTPNKGLVAAASSTDCLQAGIAQFAHAVGHGALSGQHHAVGGAHILGRAVTTTSKPLPCATCMTACATERRLPMP